MKISRVINTNAVLVKESNGEEIILLGAGIGFKCKPGDLVDQSKIDKQFVLKKKNTQLHFDKLLDNIPHECIMLSEHIISLALTDYHMSLNESIHISLADHIYTAIENFKKGHMIPNTLLLDIKQFYKNEYELAVQGIKLIEDATGYHLPESEIGFIAGHFINAQYSTPNMGIKKTVQLVKELNELILNELQVSVDENSLNYFRYMTHLKFFAQRILSNASYHDENDSLLAPLMIRYYKEYSCCKKVVNYINKNYHYTVTNDEIIYLTVHLAHLTK